MGSVTTKGQVTLPKEARDALGIHAGDKVIFDLKGDQIMVRKVRGESILTLIDRMGDLKEDSLSFQRRLRREWTHRGA
ncbi:MAG: AbrB/MazE/SpoVT family DNA-binding domain-containing protein [Euryarchaeota archaeon]|nr:AbrB/MazE/SpoVT family DNA-binding domain-containing protein [Euryarchaeota archaeon]MDE1837904.1 AbrB/MazE/SpoVT family DNA-binding domain-containing protein [Euryarchaeota archaeon]MDE1881278.1 AbrB/MazE/SpoVT family DNA-binding domain-containing protein [Euryarchaeota archaeon]MDE2046258.1 AbrB/MazE/SpoVT family DNA-binding domain-containing protein [Thermoplasmata archaeon]